MKNWLSLELSVIFLAGLFTIINSCKENAVDQKEVALNEATVDKKPAEQISEAFKEYWYAGDAEITSYTLEQARYGEIRNGDAVLIYVTEPFAPDKQVKADNYDKSNVSVLKLNTTKNYLTGIYPYSIMTSSFYPVGNDEHAIKVTFSSQEWCGHVYAQLNNRSTFEIKSHSYFESEADQNMKLDKTVLENELWNQLRIDPESLPVGEIQVIPSFEYIRLSHKELKSYKAIVSLNKNGATASYEINYPELERTLKIDFRTAFPYCIEGWSETFKSGFGDKAKTMTSKAIKNKTLKTPYWTQNGNNDLSLRDSLGL
ncbi:septum formation inhibitor Maf [Maribacter algicola]|uniref:Septum formation inhibitor Maf n=1 Tax=Meishania litoralis TaxID=3434685 RepID=A0ACC7LIV0_9FLAO